MVITNGDLKQYAMNYYEMTQGGADTLPVSKYNWARSVIELMCDQIETLRTFRDDGTTSFGELLLSFVAQYDKLYDVRDDTMNDIYKSMIAVCFMFSPVLFSSLGNLC